MLNITVRTNKDPLLDSNIFFIFYQQSELLFPQADWTINPSIFLRKTTQSLKLHVYIILIVSKRLIIACD